MTSIGIVGAGQLGGVLARRLTALGHSVSIANSRGPESLRDRAAAIGAAAVGIEEVGSGAGLLALAIPLGAVSTLPREVIASWRHGPVIVDAGNYVPLRDGRVRPIDEGMSETAWVAHQLDLPVVKAFNSNSDLSLEHGGRPRGAPDRIALPVAGDDLQARAVVMRLVEQLGFDALDAGPLADSWRQQIGQSAYCTDATRRQLADLLARAKADGVNERRNGAMRLMSRLPPDFPKAALLRAARFMAGLDRGKPANWFAMLRVVAVMARRPR